MSAIKYEHVPINESSEPLEDVSEYGLLVEPVYFKQGLSKDPRILLRSGVIKKLIEAQDKLKIYKFKLWDGFRSRQIQDAIFQQFWNETKNNNPNWTDEEIKTYVEPFVSNARDLKRIPTHATGGTIDLTLVDENGIELDMGTPFDYFGSEAFPFYFEENPTVNPTARANRKILIEAMSEVGFKVDVSEWWHFNYGNQLWALESNKPFAIYGEAFVR